MGRACWSPQKEVRNMKKGIFIAVGVVALLAVMVWADHKFPAAGAPSASSATPNRPMPQPSP